MNYVVKRRKSILALTLATSLFATTAYGAEVKTTPDVAIAVAAEQGLPVLTYEDALAKAKKKDSSLIELQKTNTFLQETKEDLWEITGSFSIPSYDYQKWINDSVYAYTSSMYSTDSSLVQNKYQTLKKNLMLEVTLMSSLSTILENEADLEITKELAKLEKTNYAQAELKYQLGLISKFQLDEIKAKSDTATYNVSRLEKSMEQTYMNLNSMIGEKPEKRFTIEYDTTYTPYVLQGTIETYINGKIRTDYDILLAEKAVEDAKFNKNYLPESSDNSSAKRSTLSYETAQRSLKDAKANKESAIRSAYIQLGQAESNYDQAQADLVQIKAKLKAAEVNYQAGNSTKHVLDQAKLAVIQQENAIKKLEYAYGMQVFSFENTCLVNSAGAM